MKIQLSEHFTYQKLLRFDNCILYGRIIFLSMPAFMLQNVFQCFFVTAERPKLGLTVIVLAGVTNMILDFLFIAVFGWERQNYTGIFLVKLVQMALQN